MYPRKKGKPQSIPFIFFLLYQSKTNELSVKVVDVHNIADIIMANFLSFHGLH